jgi:D-serine deaminase-like pyridoxal phosphate-dependent protein
MNDDLFVENIDSIESPALLIFLPRLRRNLETMIALAGSVDRLRPHVKTHKMPDLVRLLERRGVHNHKCATIAEAEMIATAGGRDVLIAYPLVGPNVSRLRRLVDTYPATTFRVTVDHPDAARALARVAMEQGGKPFLTLVDLDVGMGRTGVSPDRAVALYQLVASLPGLEPDGLHAYDGHQRDHDPGKRADGAANTRRIARRIRDDLLAEGIPVPRVVLGGTPTFPCHCEDNGQFVELSPGTCIFHDESYGTKFPDLPFEPAAFLLGRVVSKPRDDRVCLDIGSKSVAADPTGDRIKVMSLEGAKLGPQSEEHLVVFTDKPADIPLGLPLFAVPTHICPTCALHREAIVIDQGRVVAHWPVVARDRHINL